MRQCRKRLLSDPHQRASRQVMTSRRAHTGQRHAGRVGCSDQGLRGGSTKPLRPSSRSERIRHRLGMRRGDKAIQETARTKSAETGLRFESRRRETQSRFGELNQLFERGSEAGRSESSNGSSAGCDTGKLIPSSSTERGFSAVGRRGCARGLNRRQQADSELNSAAPHVRIRCIM